jgi:hypothetical protein
VATPTAPEQQKQCDPSGTAGNNTSGPNGPACNLFISTVPGPNQGSLMVIEHVDGVTTAGGIGIGAYEFQVEFDSFVIQSVNPTDIIFTAGSTTSTPPFPALGRGLPNCSMTIPAENSVRFGCVTLGQNQGPNGSFDLARLELVPSADDLKDLFPGNDNGIPTLIKDNQCELADRLGHPLPGSVNSAGQLPVCGDLYVTVRILEGDLNLDCVVDVNDEALIAAHYGAFFGSALYNKWFDLEPRFHDLDIDIKDVQKVFGRDGSTCQNPKPAQTPVPPPFPLNS